MIIKEDEKFRNRYRISSARLSGYDYTQTGLYFVTICVKNRECILGEASKGAIILSEIGEAARQCWLDIPNHFPHVSLDEFVIMPNHLHGILCIFADVKDTKNVETQNFASLQQNYANRFGPQSRNLSSIVRGFKIGVKKWAILNHEDFCWQPRFYDHVIRSDRSLNKIRQYILDNPIKWLDDVNNPINIKKSYAFKVSQS